MEWQPPSVDKGADAESGRCCRLLTLTVGMRMLCPMSMAVRMTWVIAALACIIGVCMAIPLVAVRVPVPLVAMSMPVALVAVRVAVPRLVVLCAPSSLQPCGEVSLLHLQL